MLTEFDPSTVRPQDRFACWIDVVGRLYCHANGRRGDDDPFEPRLHRCTLGAVGVSDLHCNAMRYDRAHPDQRRDQRDDFLVSLMVHGHGQLDQQGRATLQGPGHIVLYDAAQPYTYDFPSAYRILLLTIPRQAMLSRLPDAGRLTAASVSTETPLGSLAASMIRGAAALSLPGGQTAAAKVGASLMDVVCTAIEAGLSANYTSTDRQAALLKRAQDYIRTHLEDPMLDLGMIAKAVHVSPRTLSRAFACEGTTVNRWLWQARLAAGRAALLEGRAAQVAEVAARCGFTSSSHFSRQFKSAYGVLPHTLMGGSARCG